MSARPGRILALDVGTQTIGLALSDEGRLLSQPLLTISRQGVAKDVIALQKVITKHEIRHLVVGLPYELDGSEARSAKLARQVGEALREASGLPLDYVDERFSSVEALQDLTEAGVFGARRKAVVDQQAAVVILDRFLDAAKAAART